MRASFDAVVHDVERAKDALVGTVPTPRGRQVHPFPTALIAFEEHLRAASVAMPGWRRPEHEEVWAVCRAAIEEALARAERLRLEAPSLDYESLVSVIGDLIAPLEAFAEADAALPSR